MTSRELIRWTRLYEKRAKRGSSVLVTLVAAVAMAAFVYWRADEAGPLAASRAWIGATLVAFGFAFMRVPFHLYWRQDAALLAQLPIAGGALFDAAWYRCIRAALATTLVVIAGAAPLLALDAGEVSWATRPLSTTPIAGELHGLSLFDFFIRHVAVAGVLGLVAACFLPAVATWAASLVAYGGATKLELATQLAGAPVRAEARPQVPASNSAILGALPGFASTVVIVFVIIVASWLWGRTPKLSAATVLVGLAVISALALAAVRATAPKVMGTILRDVSALDRQQLATLEIRPPTALERAIASMLGEAALPYRKDARLMRRRYPMAFALGALAFLVLVIVGLARPADPMPWLVGVIVAAGLYAGALAGRLFRPPIELPRLAATLPISARARLRAKVAWVVAWAVIFVGIPLVFAAVRLS
ncbi:MAG: hypothetical protein HOV81_05060 [Kofleriaceae bacterium]|nr:hypothetical protein [Kofleriaceae bacterium]